MQRRRARTLALFMLCPVLLYGCSDARGAGPEVSREVIGDTTFVRITGAAEEFMAQEEMRIGQLEGPPEYTFGDVNGLAVSADNSIYVLDAQALTINVYDADGRHVRTFGRSGEGPGELKQPSGMLFLRDGRLVVRDPANTRMSIYSRDGEALTSWPISGGFFTDAPIFTDDDGNVYTDVITTRSEDGSWKVGLMKLNAQGVAVDTLARPFADYSPPTLRAERVSGQGRSVSMSGVPFWPGAHSALNASGEFVGGVADRYEITVWKKDGRQLRIVRETEPVSVDAGEMAAAVERTTRSMRNLQDNWKWDAPQPPAVKPAFSDVRTAEDGSIWVRVSRPGFRREADPDAKPDAQGRMPVDVWAEPSVYEIFNADGDMLGAVRLPDRFRPMVMRGDHVWGVQRDELDVQYVTRLRVRP